MKKTILLVLVVAVTGFAQAQTITVGPVAGYDFDTIQAGIDAAEDGDTVLVAPAEYAITVPITFKGKAITVQSEAGRDETTIRMDTPADTNRGSVVVFENNETVESVLDGFTITGGRGCWVIDSLVGGGIFFNASSGTLRNCAIVQNRVEGSGSGVFCAYSCSPRLIDCIIAENIAGDSLGCSGGGVFAWSGASLIMTNCIIRENSAGDSGGGVFAMDRASLTMTNCIIRENSAGDSGGGVFAMDRASLTMTNCIIRENLAERTGSPGGVGGGIFSYINSSTTMTNCAIVSNMARVGGGLFCMDNSSVTMTHCAVIGNMARQAAGGIETYLNSSATVGNCVFARNTAVSSCGGMNCSLDGGSAAVTNSIFWENTAPKAPEIWVRSGGTLDITYSNVVGGQTGFSVEGGTLNWGEGNIDADPCFADPENDDYHLKSEAGRWEPDSQSWVQDKVASPCIDCGDPDSDWRPELWPHGTRMNMGAYGGTPQASMSLSDVGNIADLNADNAVHFADFANLVGHWQVEEALIPQDLDRDGTVGPNDLVILADNWLAVVIPLPLAHWKLDETEGTIAYDSIRSNDGTLNGDPNWQPAAGKVDGALKFNGTNNYISTDFVLNPVSAFSAFAWIKGGEPGQVIICQTDGSQGSAWLCAESSEGNLRTNLMDAFFPPLESESVITDGQWHHIGLVYNRDTFKRHLYVDGAEVAKDTSMVGGLSSTSGLYIGAGTTLEEGSFFSGLIDDIRIYPMALSAKEIEELAR